MQSDNREVSLFLALISLGFFVSKSLNIYLFLAIIIMVTGIFWPNILTPITKILKLIGPRIQRVMSPIMLNMIYYLVVFPVGILQKFGENRKENFYNTTEKKFSRTDFERPY